MKKIFVIIAAVTLVTVGAIVLKTRNTTPGPQSEVKIRVVASFYPLYYFAKEIGGNRVSVTNITPSGAEPHDYEPTNNDIQKIAESDLLILNGKGLESWGGKIEGKNILSVSEGIGSTDPHTWLDPVLSQEVVKKIETALIIIAPDDRDYFESNTEALLNKLTALDSSYKEGLSHCSGNEIVTSHSAFAYLASRYGFTQISLAGLSPDEEPTPQKLTEVTRLVKGKNISYIFFETLVSPRLAETLATETNTKTLVFNPLEGLTPEEEQQGANYFSIQGKNLQSLRTALSCM